MSKFTVGQKVRIRYDLKYGESYAMSDNVSIKDEANEDMVKLAGKVVTIERIGRKIWIKEHGFNWTDNMFVDIQGSKEVEDVLIPETLGVHVLKVIYAEPATIIFYKNNCDDKKEVVKKAIAKCKPGDQFSKSAGYRVAVIKALKKELDRQLRKF
jgi:hypothetical protein